MATQRDEGSRVDTFAAVTLTIEVRLPITISDEEWIPYARQAVLEIEGIIDALKQDRRQRASDGDDKVRFINDEQWRVG